MGESFEAQIARAEYTPWPLSMTAVENSFLNHELAYLGAGKLLCHRQLRAAMAWGLRLRLL